MEYAVHSLIANTNWRAKCRATTPDHFSYGRTIYATVGLFTLALIDRRTIYAAGPFSLGKRFIHVIWRQSREPTWRIREANAQYNVNLYLCAFKNLALAGNPRAQHGEQHLHRQAILG